MELYHRDLGLPTGFVRPQHTVTVDYGSHARMEAMTDRYGDFYLPPKVNLSEFEVIEVGMENGKVAKILFRGELDDVRDICIVLIPRRPAWFCKTVWVNVRTDTHRTLDKSKYVH